MSFMPILRVLFFVMVIILTSLNLIGCQGSVVSSIVSYSFPKEPRNYRPVGFDNADQIDKYADYYEYFALKIAHDEWTSFYRKFPEYWQDIQKSKQYTFFGDYHPGYTAYAFKWLTSIKKKDWDGDIIKRLEDGRLSEGDDIFKLIYALGVQDRLIWDNDFEILIFGNKAIVLKKSAYGKTIDCDKCSVLLSSSELLDRKIEPSQQKHYILSDDSVIKILSLVRPAY